MRKKLSTGDEEGKYEYKKGLWTVEEDKILMDYVKAHGKGHWNRIAKKTGLKRCGKSCRLRWMNYLSPNVKRGHFTEQEEDLIIRLHKLLGNRWSLIAKRVPGRTDNQVKNYWNTHLSKKLGIQEQTQKLINEDHDEDQTSHADPIKMFEENCSNVNRSRNDGMDGRSYSEMNNTNQYQIQMFPEHNNHHHQAIVSLIGGAEGNHMNSLCVHEDDFDQFSTLANMVDFMDGFYF